MGAHWRVDLDSAGLLSGFSRRQRSIWLPAHLEPGFASLKMKKGARSYVEKTIHPRGAGKQGVWVRM